MSRWLILAGVVCLTVARSLTACSLCGGNLQQTPTLREEAAGPASRLILYGCVKGEPQPTATTMQIIEVLRNDPFLGTKTEVEIPRFIPSTDPKNPPRFLLFCDVYKDKLDIFRAVPVTSAEGLAYIRKVLKLDPKKPTDNLAFFAEYLEHPDKQIAGDAYLELAKATDAQIGQLGPRLSAARLRGWLKNPETPIERRSLYAFLLGTCGAAEDAALLEGLLAERGDRANMTYDGALCGYISLRPQEGWQLAKRLLGDAKAPLTLRLAVARALRLHFGWQPDKTRPLVLDSMRIMMAQGELADIAIEDLRRWKLWDLTNDVLALHGRKGYESPIVQESILRYALSCNDDASKRFVTACRTGNAELVKQIEESLRFEK